MLKPFYALVKMKTKTSCEIQDTGGITSFINYAKFLRYLALKSNITNARDFAQHYYSCYYNPDWKIDEQLCDQTRPLAKMAWFNSKIKSSDFFNIFNFGCDFSLIKLQPKTHGSWLVNDSQFNFNNDLNFELVKVIKPTDIWNMQLSTKAINQVVHDYRCNLTSLNWIPFVDHSSYVYSNKMPGSKINYNSRINSKNHFKHLTKIKRPLREAKRLQLEYDLPMMPKHMTVRNTIDDIWDLEFNCTSRCWKDQRRFRKQYEHNLIRYSASDFESVANFKQSLQEIVELS